MTTDTDAVDRDGPLSADWYTGHRALSVSADDAHDCVEDRPWCQEPDSVDLNAASIGAYAVCVATATGNGGVSN